MTEAHSLIRTLLVSGFLGAGKTTFILEQLRRSGANVAVLVNEFGELGIDGALIRSRGGIDVVEMPGGCVCCSQKEGLVKSILAIAAEIRPELLLIEPSGVAELSEVLKVLADPALEEVIRLDAAITVVDAETFLEFSEPDAFGSFFLNQVANADLIILNKADLVDAAELEAVERRVVVASRGALVVKTSFCRMDETLPAGRNREVVSIPCADSPLSCVSLVPAELSVANLAHFLAEVAAGRLGRIVRGKGFVPVRGKGLQNLQIAGRRVELDDAPGGLSPRLTLIGHGLDSGHLRELLAGDGGD